MAERMPDDRRRLQDPEEVRDIRVQVRLSPKEAARLDAAASHENRRRAGMAGSLLGPLLQSRSDAIRAGIAAWCAKVEASIPTPPLSFGPVRNDGGNRTCAVLSDKGQIGELYRESGMQEWSADGALEALYGENCCAGFSHVKDAQRELVRVHQQQHRSAK